MPFFEGAARVDRDAAGACKYCGERRASAPSAGCSQLLLGRREYFHVLYLFNALQAGKFPMPFCQGAARRLRLRGRMQILRRAKSLGALGWLLAALPPPPRIFPRFAPFQRVAGKKISHPLFVDRAPRCRDAAVGGRGGSSRAAVSASSRAVAVDGAAGRRSPVLIGSARRAFTRRPPCDRATPSDGCRHRRARIASRRSAKA
jgi:hypothetical protein